MKGWCTQQKPKTSISKKWVLKFPFYKVGLSVNPTTVMLSLKKKKVEDDVG